jgi:hypothetical protein
VISDDGARVWMDEEMVLDAGHRTNHEWIARISPGESAGSRWSTTGSAASPSFVSTFNDDDES